MTRDRLVECMALLRWTPKDLASSMGYDEAVIMTWAAGTEDMPVEVASWIEALATAHEAAEASKPIPPTPAATDPHENPN